MSPPISAIAVTLTLKDTNNLAFINLYTPIKNKRLHINTLSLKTLRFTAAFFLTIIFLLAAFFGVATIHT
jgi:hypothetical protein